jgi:hypothetical protein
MTTSLPTFILKIEAESFGFCRATPSAALKAATNCVFVEITDLFCVVAGLRMGGAIARRYCAWQIAPGEFLKSLEALS